MIRNRSILKPLAIALGLAALSAIAWPAAQSARAQDASAQQDSSLASARKDFKTAITVTGDNRPVEKPPAKVFQLVSYASEVGPLPAYLTPVPKDRSKKHPAIVWITGGDCNTIGDVWSPSPRNNEQTAAAYRNAGIVMMFPALRGGNSNNPGKREGFYGEVNDVIAAAEYLAKLPYVDPNRIYLGGHSTGGTLVLLTSEMTDRFRAVFSFGPLHEATEHRAFRSMNLKNVDPKEVQLRAPIQWLSSIRKPTFVIEGAQGMVSNADVVELMSKKTTNPQVHFLAVSGFDHFSILAPANEKIAQAILKDTGPSANISLTAEELTR